jgi:hypothetical protein
MDGQKISDSEASSLYSIETKHEKMSNGELRFRFLSKDGNGYIRTIAGEKGAWQVAHVHPFLQEIYIVEKGWMALAERCGNSIRLAVYRASEVVIIHPQIPHNIYLPAKAVIHTVKNGAKEPHDWKADPELTAKTQFLNEENIFSISARDKPEEVSADQRFSSYMALYNNLDNLIWRIPGFLATGAAVVVGFVGSALSKGNASAIPPLIISGLFFIIGLLFFLGALSMARIRKHHTQAGEWLASMESNGYFHDRRVTVKRKWPLSATLVFR